MIPTRIKRLRNFAAPFPVLALSGCSRAPSFDILGSFFPAWLICIAVALLFTVGARWVLLRMGVVVAFPILTYPSLTALFTFTLWLAFFQ